ncbi:MAG: hypothetical protein KGJ13_04275 [Patescibacteria group bacterium]|nr:hypothetical protein [Patescibacteria group bacterium]
MESLERRGNQEIKEIPEVTVSRENGLVLMNQIKNEAIFENVGDEEALFMLSLLHKHPEREAEIMRQLAEYKPHVENREELKNKVLQALAAAEIQPKSPEETGQTKWGTQTEEAREHIKRLAEYFHTDPATYGIEKVEIVPSDDLLPPQKGSSFHLNGEAIIMSRSGDWHNFDHEFLHGLINPAVEAAIAQLSEAERKRIIELASVNLKDEQGYGEHPESLLQETIIRAYVDFIHDERPRPDKAYMAGVMAALTQEQFQKALQENPLTQKQFDQLGIKNLDDLKARWEEYFDRFARNELRERVYDFLKEYEGINQSFAVYLGTNIKRLII